MDNTTTTALEESIKNERRRILSTLKNWNVGIAPSGKLATDSCFVHSSVPDIIFISNNSSSSNKIESTFISTKSERATYLVQQSSASNPGDTETIKTISVCNFIFPSSHAATTTQEETVHLIKHSVKAYVIVDSIARLTKEFEDELSQAHEHWLHSPQKSWDKLCQIWNKYGFLWPHRVHIGFKIYESVKIKQEEGRLRRDEIITSIKDHLDKKSQDTLLHSPKNYSVIWRTQLKPVHEFFPVKYHEKKEFINNAIHRFSYLVFNDCLIRLVNVGTGNYLGRRDAPLSDECVTLIPINHDKSSNPTSSNLFWKFNSTTYSEMNKSPYVFAGSKWYLCSGQYDGTTADLIVLSKGAAYLNSQRSMQQSSTTTATQPRASIHLVHYSHHLKPQQQHNIMKGTTLEQQNANDDNDISATWSIDIPTAARKSDFYIVHGVFELDNAIDTLRCLAHGDEITLNQQSMYLRGASKTDMKTKYVSSISSSLTYNSPVPQAINANKSPLSVSSLNASCDPYKFSSSFSSSDTSSTSTQPTSGSNSIYASTPVTMYKSTTVKRYRDKNFQVSHSRQSYLPLPPLSSPQNTIANTTTTPFVFIEKIDTSLAQRTEHVAALSSDNRWRVEIVSKSMVQAKKTKQQENMQQQPTIASISGTKNKKFEEKEDATANSNIVPKIIYNDNSYTAIAIKTYNPKLTFDITTPCSTPDTPTITDVFNHSVHCDRNQEEEEDYTLSVSIPPRQYTHDNSVIGISSMEADDAYYENLNQVLSNQQQQQQEVSNSSSQQQQQEQFKSKWLDIIPTIYHLGFTKGDQNENVDLIEVGGGGHRHQQLSMKTSQYETPVGSITSSIPSPAASFGPTSTTTAADEEEQAKRISKKLYGKLPLQQATATTAVPVIHQEPIMTFKKPHTVRRSNGSDSSGSDSSSTTTWSSLSSSPPPPPIHRTDTIVSIKSTPPAASLTEAETFKRGIQQTFYEQANAHKMIFRNLFSASSCASPKSSTTSQIRYYTDDDDEEATEILDPASSQLRTYTMTPHSRRQPTTPSSSAFLTTEEYMKRKTSRENSFMLLLNQETKQQIWLRAIKQSTLSHWLRVLSKGTRKKLHQKDTVITTQPSDRNIISNSSSSSHYHHFLNTTEYHHSHGISNRVIHKKKGFYFKKSTTGGIGKMKALK